MHSLLQIWILALNAADTVTDQEGKMYSSAEVGQWFLTLLYTGAWQSCLTDLSLWLAGVIRARPNVRSLYPQQELSMARTCRTSALI